ncbi:hypothetical protein AU468_02335, partial [Alkalispirochaeta sphaeroplastigenens]
MSSPAFWGWTGAEDALRGNIPGEFIPARVRVAHSSSWLVMVPGQDREVQVKLAGSFLHHGSDPGEAPLPRTGDWVLLSPSGEVIHRLLPRRTALIRQEAGRARRPQVLAANVDRAFLVFGLDGERSFSPGLLERLLTITAGAGVRPVVILNKVDLAAPGKRERIVGQVQAHYPDLPLYITSALPGGKCCGEGLEEVRRLVPAGTTACFLGRSGAGKSSLITALFGEGSPEGERIRRGSVRSRDARGRHTTSAATLWMLPPGFGCDEGGMVIDTPG